MKLIPAGYSIQTDEGEEVGYARLMTSRDGTSNWVVDFHGVDGAVSSVACPTIEYVELLVGHFADELAAVHTSRKEHEASHRRFVRRYQQTAANRTPDELRAYLEQARDAATMEAHEEPAP